jgi:hypothetical protein
MLLRLQALHIQVRPDINTIANRPCYRTVIGVKSVDSLCGITLVIHDLEMVGDKNSLDDEYIALLFNFARHFRSQVPLASRNAARFQRAPEGPGQSAAGSRNDIVQRSWPGVRNVWGNLIVLGNLGMHSKVNGILSRRQEGAAVRPFNAFNANVRCVYHLIAHNLSLSHYLPIDPQIPASTYFNGSMTSSAKHHSHSSSSSIGLTMG